jgi:hypothetical protein
MTEGNGNLTSWTVTDRVGQRKYLTWKEREAFLRSAAHRDRPVRSFCWMLAATGCRISEALALSERSIDFEGGHVIIQSLKKRGRSIFRTIPLSPTLLHQLREALDAGTLSSERLWPWSRMTGYRRVREVMQAAHVIGPHASPKGLRHAFGVCAIQSNIPLNLVQRWLGHADINTTTIYTDAMGVEEREFASRMWQHEARRSSKSASRTIRHMRGSPYKPDGRPRASDHQARCDNTSILKLARFLNYRVSYVFNCDPEAEDRDPIFLSV